MVNIPLRRYWLLLSRYIEPQKARFWLLAGLLVSSIGLQIVNPQVMRFFIDAAVGGEAAMRLSWAAVLFIVLALLQQGLAVSGRYVGENVAWTATNALRAELAAHCLHLDMSFHNNTSPGELIERIDGDVAELSNFFSQLVIRVVGNLVLLAGILVVLFFEDWRVGIALTMFAVGAVLALTRVRGLAVPYQKAFRAATADLFGFIEERLAGTEDIRSSGAVGFVINGLYELQYKILGHWRETQNRFLLIRFVGGMLHTLGTGIALALGFYLYRRSLVTIGTAYLIVHYVNLIGRPIRELTHQTEGLQNIGAATERLADLRRVSRRIKDGPGAELGPGALGITFDDVSFAYGEGEAVLDRITFDVGAGAVLGLLGRTGSGKTTLARLVFRLYDPSQGSVMLNGVDIRRSALRTLRRRVAMVTQDVQLFEASVRDNLTFFDRDIRDERIVEAIEELDLAEWYASLPEGLDTRLETGGHGLSAGEAQLLAFTRVFLRDPGVVILDEASSRLDPATEQLIERSVDKLLENRTAIIIAHRLTTVERADEVMILDGGRIVEHGYRRRLATDPQARFYRLLQTGLEGVLG
jgi:ABC-type multidrug transport system fused ATPase/permease subunit